MAVTPLVSWQYHDWRSQATTALQITRLRLHMQEVSGFALESQSKGRGLKLSPDYLPGLQQELDKLESKNAIANRSGRFGVSSFSRGAGP